MATGWGNKTWGASDWGDLSDETVLVSSFAASTSIGTSTTSANANVSVSGISSTFSIEDAVAGASAEAPVTGIQFNIVTGNEGIGIGVPVSGISSSTNIGTATIDDQFLIGEGWGRETWGSFAWGDNYSVQLQGISLSVVTGNEDAFTDVVVEVDGNSLQTAITPVGTSANSDNEIAHSFLLTQDLGTVTLEGHANVDVTGISQSISIGDAEAGLLTEVPVTGVSSTINIGNEDTTGNANVTLTGISATGSVGDIVPVSKYDATGSSATYAVGQITGVGSATVIPNGIGLTITTGSPNIIAWAEVNTGTTVTWTEVDLAA
jgi:hypothetical protein